MSTSEFAFLVILEAEIESSSFVDDDDDDVDDDSSLLSSESSSGGGIGILGSGKGEGMILGTVRCSDVELATAVCGSKVDGVGVGVGVGVGGVVGCDGVR
jgi:hypothetical protein